MHTRNHYVAGDCITVLASGTTEHWCSYHVQQLLLDSDGCIRLVLWTTLCIGLHGHGDFTVGEPIA